MKVKMYKAIDSIDKKESLFAVCGDKMAVSAYFGEDDSWLFEDGFGDFNSYDIEDLNELPSGDYRLMAISRETLAKLTDSEVQACYITSLAFA